VCACFVFKQSSPFRKDKIGATVNVYETHAQYTGNLRTHVPVKGVPDQGMEEEDDDDEEDDDGGGPMERLTMPTSFYQEKEMTTMKRKRTMLHIT
jgi:hypothetical protein